MLRALSHIPLAVIWFAGALSFAAESSGLRVRALLLVPGGPVTHLHPVSGEKAGGAVQIGARGLSQPFSPATREFILAVPDTKQESGFKAVAKVVLPAEGRDFIILLEPAGAIYKVHVVNGREPRFSADCVLFFNASEVTLGATLGPKKVLIKPRQAVFAKAPARGEKPYYQVTLYQPDKGKARVFSNTRWPHRDQGRSYVFLYRSQPAGRLTFEAIDEVMEADSSSSEPTP